MSQGRPQERPLSSGMVLSFSSLALPLGALAVAVAVYIPPFFASHLGVNLAAIGAAFAIVRMLDIGVDPILGLVMDRTRTRLGRYRVWVLAGGPILMAAVYAMFEAPHGVGTVYLIFWLLVFYLGNSILGLGHSAWAATLATEYHQRSRVFGVLAAAGVIGAVIVLIIPIVAAHLGLSEAEGVKSMGWFILILVPIVVALTCLRTPEHIMKTAPEKFALKDYLSLITKPDLLRLFLAQMALTLGPGWMSALYLFFFKDSRGFSAEQASLLLLVYVIAGIVGAPLTARLAMRFSKHRTLMVTTTAYSLGLCMVIVLPKANVPLAVPVMFWCGFMAAGFDLMIRAMLADVADEVRLEQGQERLSLIYALNALANKIASAFAIGLTFPLLARIGYDATAGAGNTPQAIFGLEMAYIVGPIIFVMLGGACVLGWRLDADKHADIRRQLDERDAVYAEAPIIESVGAEPAIAVLSDKGG
ncbi:MULTISPECIES: MFS transporter [Phenylobacterium]|uniref:Na+/melibiose symporter-like transporter n=1 Tax=Phenylobacterium koreense TaxID=266125 RepID=A0ABV2EIC9_9CAUL